MTITEDELIAEVKRLRKENEQLKFYNREQQWMIETLNAETWRLREELADYIVNRIIILDKIIRN